MKETVYPVHVEFGDCDPARIVWFPNFFRWIDAASRDFFVQCGVPTWTRYRGWRAESWTACVARGSRAVTLHWSGGPTAQWNVVTSYVATLVEVGADPIRIATASASRPLAQLHGLVRSLRARHPAANLEVVESPEGVAPFDLGAPA